MALFTTSSFCFIRHPRVVGVKIVFSSILNKIAKKHVFLQPPVQEDSRVHMAPLENTTNIENNKETPIINLKVIIPIVTVITAVAAAVILSGKLSNFDFTQIIEEASSKIEKMGPYGYLYFALIYIVAEVLAVPAIPLTASSGYLFGLIPGFSIVLVSATIAASISFLIGRTLLRGWASKIASGNMICFSYVHMALYNSYAYIYVCLYFDLYTLVCTECLNVRTFSCGDYSNSNH